MINWVACEPGTSVHLMVDNRTCLCTYVTCTVTNLASLAPHRAPIEQVCTASHNSTSSQPKSRWDFPNFFFFITMHFLQNINHSNFAGDSSTHGNPGRAAPPHVDQALEHHLGPPIPHPTARPSLILHFQAPSYLTGQNMPSPPGDSCLTKMSMLRH